MARAIPQNVKKKINGNLLVEVDIRRQTENIPKMKSFYTTKYRAYPHKRLNTSKGVIRSIELTLAIAEEMTADLGKHEVTIIQRMAIRKGKE